MFNIFISHKNLNLINNIEEIQSFQAMPTDENAKNTLSKGHFIKSIRHWYYKAN